MRIGLPFLGMISPGGYSAEAQAVISQMPDNMSVSLKDAIADFVDSQVASGNWDKIIEYINGRLNTLSNSLTGWKLGTLASLNNSAFWLQYRGWTTDGANSYVNTGFIPADHASFGLSDAGFGAGVRVNETTGSGAAMLFGVLNGGVNSILVTQSGSAGTTLGFTVNSSTLPTSTVDNVLNDHTYYAVDRVNGTEVRLIINDAVAATGIANAAASKATDAVFLGARNSAGTPQNRLNGTFGYFVAYQGVDFDHASFYNANVALDAAIDAIIGDITLLYDFGQSNAGGQGEADRLVALTSYTNLTPVGAYVFQKPGFDLTIDGKWKPLSVGVNSSEAGQTGEVFGAGVTYTQKFISEKSRPAFYANGARGGSSLAQVAGEDWDPDSVGECFDISFDAIFTPSYDKLVQHFPNNTIKVVLSWHQGEADAVSNSASYLTNFEAFMIAVRAYHASLATAPLIITKLYYNLNAGETVINAAFDTYAGANENVYVLDVASQVTYPRKVDLPADTKSTYPPTLTDDNHNSYEFQVKKGEMIYDKLVEIGYI